MKLDIPAAPKVDGLKADDTKLKARLAAAQKKSLTINVDKTSMSEEQYGQWLDLLDGIAAGSATHRDLDRFFKVVDSVVVAKTAKRLADSSRVIGKLERMLERVPADAAEYTEIRGIITGLRGIEPGTIKAADTRNVDSQLRVVWAYAQAWLPK